MEETKFLVPDSSYQQHATSTKGAHTKCEGGAPKRGPRQRERDSGVRFTHERL